MKWNRASVVKRNRFREEAQAPTSGYHEREREVLYIKNRLETVKRIELEEGRAEETLRRSKLRAVEIIEK